MGEIRRHPTYNDRIRIETLYNIEHRKAPYIAEKLGFGRSTIYRELERGYCENRDYLWRERRVYSADVAQQDYEEKAALKGPQLKIGHDHKLAAYIEDKIINHKFSPEAVLLKIQEDGLQFSVTISKTTLYRYIDNEFLNVTNKYLVVGKHPQKSKDKNPPSISYKNPMKESIENRPAHIAEREEFGHWEMDTVVGTAKGVSTSLLVLTERKTRDEIGLKLETRTAEAVVKAINKLERKFEREHKGSFAQIFKTITVDNGSEFSDVFGIQTSCYKRKKGPRTKVYYCHPYSSYERGSNENQNKLIRRFIPKGTPITDYTAEEIERIIHWINHYPRRLFDGKSSDYLFQQELKNLIA